MDLCDCGSRQLPTRGEGGNYYCKACSRPITPGGQPGPSGPPPLIDHVTTLDWVPDYRVVKTLGLVSAIGANSGWTAKTKGDIADDRAQDVLMQAAARLGADAVLGVRASAFGAGGGITGAFGGDAVGILYVGTAAVVEPETPHGTEG